MHLCFLFKCFCFVKISVERLETLNAPLTSEALLEQPGNSLLIEDCIIQSKPGGLQELRSVYGGRNCFGNSFLSGTRQAPGGHDDFAEAGHRQVGSGDEGGEDSSNMRSKSWSNETGDILSL